MCIRKYLNNGLLITGLFIVSSSVSYATPRASIVKTFNDVSGASRRTGISTVDFNISNPKGWDSPVFRKAADDLHKAVTSHKIRSPTSSPHYLPPAPKGFAP